MQASSSTPRVLLSAAGEPSSGANAIVSAAAEAAASRTGNPPALTDTASDVIKSGRDDTDTVAKPMGVTGDHLTFSPDRKVGLHAQHSALIYMASGLQLASPCSVVKVVCKNGFQDSLLCRVAVVLCTVHRSFAILTAISYVTDICLLLTQAKKKQSSGMGFRLAGNSFFGGVAAKKDKMSDNLLQQMPTDDFIPAGRDLATR